MQSTVGMMMLVRINRIAFSNFSSRTCVYFNMVLIDIGIIVQCISFSYLSLCASRAESFRAIFVLISVE